MSDWRTDAPTAEHDGLLVELLGPDGDVVLGTLEVDADDEDEQGVAPVGVRALDGAPLSFYRFMGWRAAPGAV